MVVLVVADPLRGAGGFCVCSCKKGVRVCFDWACFFGELFWVKQVWEVFCSGSCEETVGADTTGPARGKGRFGYWAYGIPCGYMSGDLLLTFQVPQGNLETMMRILINSAGALCAYTSVGRSRTMVTVASRSQMRVVLCPPPPPRVLQG